MIKPDRHTKPKYSILNISTIILSELNRFYAISYDNLLNKVVLAIGEEAKTNFPYALSFLFLLGKINYDQVTDSFKSDEIK
ncbi:MAG: ABC-three component system middle component 8 [Flavobacterium sp.]